MKAIFYMLMMLMLVNSIACSSEDNDEPIKEKSCVTKEEKEVVSKEKCNLNSKICYQLKENIWCTGVESNVCKDFEKEVSSEDECSPKPASCYKLGNGKWCAGEMLFL